MRRRLICGILILALFLVCCAQQEATKIPINLPEESASSVDNKEEPPAVKCVEKWSCTKWEPNECPESAIQARLCTDSNNCGTTGNKPSERKDCVYVEKDIERTTAQISKEFSGLTDLQMEEKLKEFKGKRIKTSLYVDEISEATSSQYLVMENAYNSAAIKAFFPSTEKETLLKVNREDTIVFSGEFVSYTKGSGYYANVIEFTNSRLIEI